MYCTITSIPSLRGEGVLRLYFLEGKSLSECMPKVERQHVFARFDPQIHSWFYGEIKKHNHDYWEYKIHFPPYTQKILFTLRIHLLKIFVFSMNLLFERVCLGIDWARYNPIFPSDFGDWIFSDLGDSSTVISGALFGSFVVGNDNLSASLFADEALLLILAVRGEVLLLVAARSILLVRISKKNIRIGLYLRLFVSKMWMIHHSTLFVQLIAVDRLTRYFRPRSNFAIEWSSSYVC